MAGDDEALPPPMEEEMEEFVPKLTRKEVDCGHWALLGRGRQRLMRWWEGGWRKEVFFFGRPGEA
jgi:hypothetical protein